MCVALSQLHTCAEGPNKDAWVQYAFEAMAAYRLKYAGNADVAGPHFVKAQTWSDLAAAFDQTETPEHVLIAETMLREVFATIKRPLSTDVCRVASNNNTTQAPTTTASSSNEPQQVDLLFTYNVREAVNMVACDAKIPGLCDDADKLENELQDEFIGLLVLQPVAADERVVEVLGRVRSVLVEFIGSEAFDAQKHHHVRKTFDQVNKTIQFAKATQLQLQQQRQPAASAAPSAAK
jgi:hypothetical protein